MTKSQLYEAIVCLLDAAEELKQCLAGMRMPTTEEAESMLLALESACEAIDFDDVSWREEP